jgi:hypothetical protein
MAFTNIHLIRPFRSVHLRYKYFSHGKSSICYGYRQGEGGRGGYGYGAQQQKALRKSVE